MKLVRYGAVGMELPGAIDQQGLIRDLSSRVPDFDSAFFANNGLDTLRDLDLSSLPVVNGQPRLGACVANVGKIVGVGLNYADHAKESGAAVPEEPVLFLKPSSSICGPNDNVEIPVGSTKTDWEVELALVIGRQAKYVSKESAMEFVAGYCILNDVSERAFQFERGGQWDKGKAHDTFAPVGPWLVTRDEIHDPQQLGLWLEVNGRRYQQGSTANMIFDLSELISYISHFMTLEPGDIVTTGTPAGVGLGQSPPLYLKAGDVMRLGIDDLGVQEQRCVQAIYPG